jgi:hypothetical protein
LKGRVEDEIRKLKAGDRGERMAAHILDTHYGRSPNWVLLHDLRIEHEGQVAQIDHLLIGRCLDFWVLESKNFANGVKINEHGEFVTFFENRPRGVDSPIEQNGRHLMIMQRMIDGRALILPKRLGFTLNPRLRSLILISGGAIGRPRGPIPGLETVIRSDQAATYIQQADTNGNPLDLARLIGTERLAELGRDILALHKPIQFDWERRLGLRPVEARLQAVPKEATQRPAPQKPTVAKPAVIKAACHSCGTEVSKGVEKFCRENAEQTKGAILCLPCQQVGIRKSEIRAVV